MKQIYALRLGGGGGTGGRRPRKNLTQKIFPLTLQLPVDQLDQRNLFDQDLKLLLPGRIEAISQLDREPARQAACETISVMNPA